MAAAAAYICAETLLSSVEKEREREKEKEGERERERDRENGREKERDEIRKQPSKQNHPTCSSINVFAFIGYTSRCGCGLFRSSGREVS